MSEVQKAITPINQLPLGEVRLAGKIQSSRRYERNFFTLIVVAAKDEWSSPQRFEIKSEEKLGEKDDVINVRCSLSGSIRTFNYLDRESGEKKNGIETKVILTVID